MRRTRIVLLTTVASLGIVLVALTISHFRSEATLAAPRSDYNTNYLLSEFDAPLYQSSVTCSIDITTTDSLDGNETRTTAATLAPYSGLALIEEGYPGENIDSRSDWFRLDNANIGSNYEVKAVPDRTNNYNLGIILYDSDGTTEILRDENTSDYRALVSFEADDYGPYFFRIYQASSQCSGGTYHLDYSVTTPTSEPTPRGADAYEPNDSMGDAYPFPVATSANANNLNFVPSSSDQDWFSFYVKNDRRYRASTSDLSGVDTYLEIYNRDNERVANDNDGGGGFASKVEWTADYGGYYYIKVTNRVGVSDSNDTYDLSVAEISASPSATDTPGPVPTSPNADRCDKKESGNYDFDHACIISANVSENLNFVPPPYGGIDNDYFKMWIKPGLLYECRTSDLSPGVDPNMIVYDNNRNAIGGNDDVEPGNFNSYFAYYATYEGWLYILVGTGDRIPPNVADSDYTLRCDLEVSGQTTEEPDETGTPTRTPRPQEPTSTPRPAATPTPRKEITVRTLTTPTPAPATTATPSSRFMPIRLLVYYDGNNDNQPGAGEGIAGVSAQAYEVASNQLLAQGYTDEQGNLEFTVASSGPVRVKVPYFGFSQLVGGGEGASIYLRVPPQSHSEGTP